MKSETIRVRPAGLTEFDSIKDTLGSADRQTRTINGTRRNSIVNSGAHIQGGTTVFRAGGAGVLQHQSGDGVAVPSLPRRNYIPTVRQMP